MKLVRTVEFAMGWLAVALGVVIMLLWWLGGFISPDSVVTDVTAFSLILAVIALSVTLESVTGSLVACITLVIGTLALAIVWRISFLFELEFPTALAAGATLMALARHLPPPAPRRISA
ncbi:MAG TPA: hypothetical protein VHI51_03580 [Ktedonobacterales bacterium]|nr:hypothetical protein [Ktedonobacterales bacterium]